MAKKYSFYYSVNYSKRFKIMKMASDPLIIQSLHVLHYVSHILSILALGIDPPDPPRGRARGGRQRGK